MFDRRWRKLDYNRRSEEGSTVDPAEELKKFGSRKVYGRNGRGRHAGFRFSDPYIVRTWRDGIEVTYEVTRGATRPFDITRLNTRDGVEGHGTEISASAVEGINVTAEEAREIIGTRFLADPNFSVVIDGARVSCTRFRRHQVRCFMEQEGASWREGSLRGSSSLRLSD
jgi:hypothetical protein